MHQLLLISRKRFRSHSLNLSFKLLFKLNPYLYPQPILLPSSSCIQRLYRLFFLSSFASLIGSYNILGLFLMNCYQTKFSRSYDYYMFYYICWALNYSDKFLFFSPTFSLLIRIWNPNSVGQYSRLQLLQFVSPDNFIGISHRSLCMLLKNILMR